MSREPMSFESASAEVLPGELRLLSVEGEQALSQLYELKLHLEVAADGGLGPEAMEDLLRQPCRVRIGREDPAEIAGTLAAIELGTVHDDGHCVYDAWLVPRVWQLGLTRRSRVFQDLSVDGIVRAVLLDAGFQEGTDFELRLDVAYPVREYVVQYQESDLAFVERLLEHWGIFYFFVQEPDGERLVIADDNRACAPLSGAEMLQYVPRDERNEREAALTAWRKRLSAGTASVLLRDYNWRTPRVPLFAQAQADDRTGLGFVHRYGDHFKTPEEGLLLAQRRGELMRVGRERYEGECLEPGLSPGHVFALSGHPLGEMDRRYLVTGVRHTVGREGEGLTERHEVRAVPAEVAYRPALRAPRPSIEGVMHAHVDGEVAGTAAPIDELGRYKVLLPFDLAGRAGGRASRWIRMAQPSSGAGYGVHFPLHIGTEVVIAHLDGDPDRPIIVGSVPNVETLTPVRRANATASAIRTRSGILVHFDDDC